MVLLNAKKLTRNSFRIFSILFHLSLERLPPQTLTTYRRITGGGGRRMKDATYGVLIRSCKDTRQLKRLHARFVSPHFPKKSTKTTYLFNLLLRAHGELGGALEDSIAIFNSIPSPDIFSWNIILASHANNGHLRPCLEEGPPSLLPLYERMLSEGNKPDKFTFLPLLWAAAAATQGFWGISQGKRFHVAIVSVDLASDMALQTSLVDMYAKQGWLRDARMLFEAIEGKDLVAWNAMVMGYAHNGHMKEALGLCQLMESEVMKPTKGMFLGLLNSCSNISDGIAIREYIPTKMVEMDMAMQTALLVMYGRCGSLKSARIVFNKMARRDPISWIAMLAAYAQNGLMIEALEIFRQMISEKLPKLEEAALCILNSCSHTASLEYGRATHESILTSSGVETNIVVQNALISMYERCGSLEEARSVFDGMHRKDLISWNSVIMAYAKHGFHKEALELFHEMGSNCVRPDEVTFLSLLTGCANSLSLEDGKTIHEVIRLSGLPLSITLKNALIHMYAKCGSLVDAQSIFDGMHCRDAISWSTMIVAYTENGRSNDDALKLLQQMKLEGVKPDEVTFLCLLNACGSQASLENGRLIHEYISTSGMQLSKATSNSLINMYGKCGSLEEARLVFNGMHSRDAISWNCMLCAFVCTGHDREALELFHQMDSIGLTPDKFTFLCILNACSKVASLAQGKAIHEYLSRSGEYASDVAVNTALLHMYGKCGGNLKEVQAIFDEMLQPDVVSWNAMLAVYAQNGYGELVLELFRQMNQLPGAKPDKITFICILTACSRTGFLDEGWEYFISMTSNYSLTPSQEHYACIIDLIGRGGWLHQVQDLMDNMPVQNDTLTLTTLSGAYQNSGN